MHLLTLINIAVGIALVLIAIVVTHRLIRNREDVENELRTSEERFEYAVLASNDGIWDWSLRSEDLFFSARFESLLGFEPGAMRETPASFLRRIHPRDRHAAASGLAHAPACRQLVRPRIPHSHAGSVAIAGSARADARCSDRTAGLGAWPGSLTDITDRKQTEAQIFEEKERAQVTLASIADAVITVDTSGRVEFLNPVAERLTGWRNEDARKCPVTTVFSVMDESTGLEVPDPVARALRDGCIVEPDGNVVLRRTSDAPVAIDHSVAPIRDRMGAVIGAVLVFHDMSRERQYATRLAHLASHDPLTGLLNRREFERRLSMVLVDGAQPGVNHAVLYLDLDQFKLVNDTCGHAAGDELLRQIACCSVRGCARATRWRGSAATSSACCSSIARPGPHCTSRKCCALPWPSSASSGRTARSTSASASASSNVSDASQTLAAVLSAADAACYMAKDNGRNRVQVYRPDSNEVALRHGEMEWVNRLHARWPSIASASSPSRFTAREADNQTPPYTELLLRLRDENNQSDSAGRVPAGGRAIQPDAGHRSLGHHHRLRHARAAPGSRTTATR